MPQEPLAEQAAQELLLVVFTQAVLKPVFITTASSVAKINPFFGSGSKFGHSSVPTFNGRRYNQTPFSPKGSFPRQSLGKRVENSKSVY